MHISKSAARGYINKVALLDVHGLSLLFVIRSPVMKFSLCILCPCIRVSHTMTELSQSHCDKFGHGLCGIQGCWRQEKLSCWQCRRMPSPPHRLSALRVTIRPKLRQNGTGSHGVTVEQGGDLVPALEPNAMRGECRRAVKRAQLRQSPALQLQDQLLPAPVPAIYPSRPWLTTSCGTKRRSVG